MKCFKLVFFIDVWSSEEKNSICQSICYEREKKNLTSQFSVEIIPFSFYHGQIVGRWTLLQIGFHKKVRKIIKPKSNFPVQTCHQT
jgi:hypothetical protein